jgi:hypothetical protein
VPARVEEGGIALADIDRNAMNGVALDGAVIGFNNDQLMRIDGKPSHGCSEE